MKLQIAPYNNTGGTWTEAEETSFLFYKLRHKFNNPAEAVITIADTNGTKAQKYNVDADDVYIGPAKVTIEHPDATDVFYGRIVKAEADSKSRTVILYCQDWMSQLDEERITYDMREKLTGDERQRGAHTDPDNALIRLRAPVVRTLYSAQADDGGAFTDETTAANDDTTNDMTLIPATPVVNDAYYFGFESKVSGMHLDISTQGDWAGTMIWEYWDGNSWAGLAIGSPTNAKWVFEVSGETSYTWTVPGDWATTSVNGITTYWVRGRVATYSSITTQPKGKWAWAEYYLYDDGVGFTTDAYNGMFLCFVHGDNIVDIWPYDETVAPSAAPMSQDAFNTDIEDLWNDNDNGHTMSDSANWTVDYKLRPLITASNFWTSTSKATIMIKYYWTGTGSAILRIYDYNAAGYVTLGDLPETSGTVPEYKTYTIPTEYLAKFIDGDGESIIQVSMTVSAGTNTLKVFELKQSVTAVYAIGTNAVEIEDTLSNRLRLGEDITHEDGSWGIWEDCQYSITQYIYKHMESATGLIGGGDTIVALTYGDAQIENTSGLSLRQFKGKTRLEIIRDLIEMDKAVIWIALGGTTITYKSTFNSGSPVAMTDATVEGWKSVFDYSTMTNEYDVYGARKGDSEVYQNSTDATSIAKYKATCTKVIRNAGLVTQRDALQLGANMVTRDANVQQMIYCTIAGLDSTYRLGTEVSITSTYLGLTAAKYIVVDWSYDSENHKTSLTLHPRVSQQGLMRTAEIGNQIETMRTQAHTARNEQYVPEPITNEVS